MAYLSDSVLDNGLATVPARSGLAIHVLASEPGTYAAVSSGSLGNKADPSVSGPANATGGGRKITIAAVSDGSITASGTASHWALVDNATTELLAANSLTSSQPVTSGNSFSLTAIDITFPDPA